MKKFKLLLVLYCALFLFILGTLQGCTANNAADSAVLSYEQNSSQTEFSTQSTQSSRTESSLQSEEQILQEESSIQVEESAEDIISSEESAEYIEYTFRNEKLLNQHYQKHGIDMGFSSPEEYERAAAAVPNDPDVLHKTEAEDGDDVYYIEATNEFVVVSTDGYIRTYFNPDRGIDYYNRQ